MELTENKQIKQEKIKEIQLKLKKYIQPFEKILAYEELKVLTKLNDENYIPSFEKEADETVTVSTKTALTTLQEHLSYWERIGVNELYPSLQVVYEMSPDNLFNVDEQILLNNAYESYPKNRKLRYGVHDLHEYRGKFFPQLVKSLINISGVSKKSLVLDPFGGSGTTCVEANVLGMESIAMDLNPLSVKISRIKTEILRVDGDIIYNEAINLIESLENPLINPPEEQWSEKDLAYLKLWFDPQALIEVSNIIKAIDCCENKTIKEFFQICLSNIIRSVSWQKESDLRVRKEITVFESGTAYTLFINEVKRQVDKLIPYLEIVKQKAELGSTKIIEGNTKEVCTIFKENVGKCNVLITSPPYATALPYLDTDRLSLIV
ncbi:DNA methyltransferase [Priestia aryabhattai]|uniref:DNA methyltransferase n=1 Tax=Priestia aryabhattai TaxID=412384 RepID=UPI00265825F9|nr:DNA methyltransferase [Priestia aryabhattai]WKG33407.1 DNA methyltransferase [Priestia aryabhattai]